jgi:hypothetical protein
LVRLQKSLLPVVEKYGLFGESAKAAAELKKFLVNFELLQVGFGFVEQQLQDATNRSSAIEQELKRINTSFQNLFDEYNLQYLSQSPQKSKTSLKQAKRVENDDFF